MFEITLLQSSQASSYETLTYKQHRTLLGQTGDNPSVIAIGAQILDEAVGLVLGQYTPTNAGGILLTLFVKPNYRKLGIGKALLQAFEQRTAHLGCSRLELKYVKASPPNAALEYLLAQNKWNTPETRLWIYKIDENQFKSAAWIYKYKLPASCTTSRWCDLSADERQQLALGEGVWYPRLYSPFADEGKGQVEPLNSLVLLHNGSISGWIMTQRIADDTVLYNTLFVKESLQTMGFSIVLLAQAVKLHLEAGIHFGMFAVYIHNKSMLKFVNRCLAPYSNEIKRYDFTAKSL